MKSLLDWSLHWLVRAFFQLLRLTPERLARSFCRALAAWVWLLDAKHRRIGLINLEIAFPERSVEWRTQVLKRSFQQLGDLAVEISRLIRLRPEEIRRRVEYEEGRGLENYLQARSQGRGVVFVTAHVSAWELLPLAHALLGHPLRFVVRPLDNPYLERWLARIRCQAGNQTISKKQAMRSMLKTLQAGGDIGILIDQNVQPQEAVFAPMFGRPAATTSAPAVLALKTGAPVVLGFLIPDENRAGRYRIRFYPPLQLTPGPDRRRDLLEATAQFNLLIEEVIRENPHCWLWGHRRFAAQPEGGNSPYSA